MSVPLSEIRQVEGIGETQKTGLMSAPSSEIRRVEGMGETQKTAFEALRAGKAFGEAALAAGVARATVYRWLRTDPYFRAAYNAWQQELVASARARLLKLTDQAVSVVEHSLGRNDKQVAMGVLKSMGAMRGPGRGTTDPEVLALKMELEQKQQQYRAALGLMKHLLTKMGLSPAQQRDYIRANGIEKKLVGKKAIAAQSLPGPQAIADAIAASDAEDGNDVTTGETHEGVSHEMAAEMDS
jgi:hypothetical protein